MAEEITVSALFPANPKKIYQAWLDSKAHGEFTGSEAVIDPVKDGSFTAWDGYIRGKNLELEPYTRIIQSWRTTDFADTDPDSRLEIILEDVEDGTRLTLVHTNIPNGQAAGYEQGWTDYYFTPMQEYFSK
jgi:activator of HSP90 ATPase